MVPPYGSEIEETDKNESSLLFLGHAGKGLLPHPAVEEGLDFAYSHPCTSISFVLSPSPYNSPSFPLGKGSDEHLE